MLSNLDINNYFKVVDSRDLYRGAFAAGSVPDVGSCPAAFAVLSCPAPDCLCHWLGCFRENERSLYFFDSFGRPPEEFNRTIIDFTSRYNYQYNKIKFQDNSSVVCGYYCIFVILRRAEGCTWHEIISELENCEDSDVFVENAVILTYNKAMEALRSKRHREWKRHRKLKIYRQLKRNRELQRHQKLKRLKELRRRRELKGLRKLRRYTQMKKFKELKRLNELKRDIEWKSSRETELKRLKELKRHIKLKRLRKSRRHKEIRSHNDAISQLEKCGNSDVFAENAAKWIREESIEVQRLKWHKERSRHRELKRQRKLKMYEKLKIHRELKRLNDLKRQPVWKTYRKLKRHRDLKEQRELNRHQKLMMHRKPIKQTQLQRKKIADAQETEEVQRIDVAHRVQTVCSYLLVLIYVRVLVAIRSDENAKYMKCHHYAFLEVYQYEMSNCVYRSSCLL